MKKYVSVLSAAICVASIVNAQELPSASFLGTINSNAVWNIEESSVGLSVTSVTAGYSTRLTQETEGFLEVEVSANESEHALRVTQAYLGYTFGNGFYVEAGAIPTLGYVDISNLYAYSYYINPVVIEYIEQPLYDVGVSLHYQVSDRCQMKLSVLSGRGSAELTPAAGGDELMLAAEYIASFGVLLVDVYGNVTPNTGVSELKPEVTTGFSGGIEVEAFRGGLEYVFRMNNNGLDVDEGQMQAAAAFGVIPVTYFGPDVDVELFARLDLLYQNMKDFNKSRVSAGVQYATSANIKLALKYDLENYEESSRDASQSVGLFTDFQF